MSGTLPKEHEVRVLISEDVRVEPGAKLTLLGFVAGNTLIVGDLPSNAALQIAFILLIEGGEGTFDMVISLKSPGGVELLKDARKIPKLKGRNAAHIFKILNLPAEIGQYKFEISLDGTHYRPFFNVARNLESTPTI